jgi:hypothetical protein
MTQNGSRAVPDGRPPTVRHVAARAGVSKSLVSLVLRDSPHVAPAKRKAVQDAIKELGYRPNGTARSLTERRTRAIGVVVNDLRNAWMIDCVYGLNAGFSASGVHMFLGDGGLDRRLTTVDNASYEIGRRAAPRAARPHRQAHARSARATRHTLPGNPRLHSTRRFGGRRRPGKHCGRRQTVMANRDGQT